ncbi:membrane-bound lytic murein transglycosylase A [Paracandidimonas soli]|uniref:peptidoglycan lytic exotransglycosylase n=1 Tax=Paracandidimonas soli TaxID=1917182 RepID=A0A4R3V4Z7_9BURK|nr:membrane-bound lytic murein transglycosylase A [Paracandidimonas soli]
MLNLKRLSSFGLLALLAACSSVPPHDTGFPAEPGESGKPAVDDIAARPLQVPDLSVLPETSPRVLKGKFLAVTWAALPGWNEDDLSLVWKGFLNNCKGLMRPVSGSLAMPARAAPRAWQPVCKAAAAMGESAGQAEVRAFLQQHLQPWRLLDAAGKPARNTVTGYYEPLVRASRKRDGAYQWPLYAAPDDLLTIDLGSLYPELAGKRVRGKLQGKRVVPYDTRADIAAAASPPKAIVMVDDPVEAFFLQIQGSGRAQLPNGSMIRLAYADHNGWPYSSIGRWLADQGELPLAQTSMQNIKAWAQRNPARVQEMLNANKAMVFFREEPVIDPELGPKGAYGIPLVGERAIAVDPEFVPLGAPVFLATQYPAEQRPLRRLVFAQDTGAAIKGAARADYYWGFGDQAGAQAGRMKQQGEMWVLWPKQAGAPSAR